MLSAIKLYFVISAVVVLFLNCSDALASLLGLSLAVG
jgi:hypothetical protein